MTGYKQFWHMQMHPIDTDFFDKYGRLILEHLNFIGMGVTESNDEAKISDFMNKMKIGDIVAIRKGFELIALVEITSYCYIVNDIDENSPLGWITHRRDIKVLAWAKEKYVIKSQGTLSICANDDAETNIVIKEWYDEVKTALAELGIKN